ncbi:hypothetical protein BJX61DRAFT_529921 [Aspergillus egyptiacus]|nr:hypothetical protein BJX61DRAFT_529921 [Aspergillus egyptiacus]
MTKVCNDIGILQGLISEIYLIDSQAGLLFTALYTNPVMLLLCLEMVVSHEIL